MGLSRWQRHDLMNVQNNPRHYHYPNFTDEWSEAERFRNWPRMEWVGIWDAATWLPGLHIEHPYDRRPEQKFRVCFSHLILWLLWREQSGLGGPVLYIPALVGSWLVTSELMAFLISPIGSLASSDSKDLRKVEIHSRIGVLQGQMPNTSCLDVFA